MSNSKDKQNKPVIYVGSFDPITYGHLDIIEQASSIFTSLIVAVAYDNGKDTLFTTEERVHLIQETLLENQVLKGNQVKVVSFQGLLVNFMSELKIDTIIRGLRAASDFEYEFKMASMNRILNSDVNTVFLTSNDKYHFISSRAVKQVASLQGNVSQLVPKIVQKALTQKFPV